MARGIRLASRTAQNNGRQSYAASPLPVQNDQITPVSDSSPQPAQLSRPPTSDGVVVVAPPGTASIYTSSSGNVGGVNTTPPQILSREA